MQDRTLDSMFPIANPSQGPVIIGDTTSPSHQGANAPPILPSARVRNIAESECSLTSVCTLRNSILKGKHRSEYATIV